MGGVSSFFDLRSETGRAGGSDLATALGILPLGTANDFARGCGVPLDPYEALMLAATGDPIKIDVPSANGVHFANPDNQFVHHRQVRGFEIELTSALPINLDGEPQRWKHIRFEIWPKCLPVILPADFPVIRGS